MIIVGLTGSIGMGKSTAARILRDEYNIPVHDADATVHALMDFGGEAVTPILAVFPEAFQTNEHNEKAIDRKKLGRLVFQDPTKLKALENILHPLVREHTDSFLLDEFNKGSQLVILDIPLLYETRGEDRCDAVLVVTVSDKTQRERVFARDQHMTEERFQSILEKQVPNKEKCLRADFILSMEDGIEKAQQDIEALIPKFKALKAKRFFEIAKKRGFHV